METLRLGSTGLLVSKWQTYLLGEGLYEGETSGTFDSKTKQATQAFQKAHGLGADGVAGKMTLDVAVADGFSVSSDEDIYDTDDESGPGWPAPPPGMVPASLAVRQKLFGTFAYAPAPSPGFPEGIKILSSWVQQNIVLVEVPQLRNVKDAPSKVAIHKAIAPQFLALLQAWEKAGLLPLLKTWSGTFVPRFVRGSKTSLSNHSWGTAFDCNYKWNQLGKRPALKGEEGSVRELVELAVAYGFYWGGWYKDRPDGMHFEAVRVLTAEELAALSA